MNYKLVKASRLNSNEDSVRLINVYYESGEYVEAGQILYELESTKTVQEYESDYSGYIYYDRSIIGTSIEVDSILFIISNDVICQKEIESIFILNQKKDLSDHDSFLDFKYKRIINKSNQCLIIGAGGHAKQVYDVLRDTSYHVVGFICNDTPLGAEVIDGLRVIGRDSDLTAIYNSGIKYAFIGVGALGRNYIRKKIYDDLLAQNFLIPPIVHSSSSVSSLSDIGYGVVVLRGSIIGPNVRIGNNTIINQGVNISHDSIIGDNCNITPNAIIAGSCSIGSNCTIGMGVTIYAGVEISDDITVPNLTSVLSNIYDNDVKI